MSAKTDKPVALVTGAGSRGGIGRAIALVLARKGVHVALTDVERDPSTLPPDELESHWQGIDSVAKAAAAHMVQRGRGGRIVTIGSDMSKRALPKTAAYAASKFGVLSLTQAAAMDLAEHGITVNAVCPGPVRTNRFNYAEQDKAQHLGQALDTVRESGWDAKAAAIPLGRAASVDDVANLVGFLTSEQGGYITGQGYNVNGGLFFH